MAYCGQNGIRVYERKRGKKRSVEKNNDTKHKMRVTKKLRNRIYSIKLKCLLENFHGFNESLKVYRLLMTLFLELVKINKMD